MKWEGRMKERHGKEETKSERRGSHDTFIFLFSSQVLFPSYIFSSCLYFSLSSFVCLSLSFVTLYLPFSIIYFTASYLPFFLNLRRDSREREEEEEGGEDKREKKKRKERRVRSIESNRTMLQTKKKTGGEGGTRIGQEP